MPETIEIDGGHGEGGGAILRVGVALSAVTGKPIKISNIRAKRCNPGIRPQHLEAVKAVAKLCGAELKGAKIGSTALEFYPKELRSGELRINIPTAGSVGLVLQGLMIAAAHVEKKIFIKIEGGATNGKWAAPVNYIRAVLLPMLEKMGYEAGVEIERYGYYPVGGALVSMWINPCLLQPLQLTEQGNIVEIFGISHASQHLQNAKVAERQKDAADGLLYDKLGVAPEIESKYVDAACPGSAIDLWLRTEKSVLGSEGLGERGKTAEKVGTEAAKSLVEEFKKKAPLDSHLADQILPYIAFAAERGSTSSVKVAEITGHCRTNIWLIEKFLPVKFRIDEGKKIISCKKV
jgi:RNA 3'-terminal phosphate cyclase (ATP)/RNA 3'-terminal phosphate cyclase (GTP)